MFKIEKNVPMPTGEVKPGKPAKYPFAAMQVGDSFFIPTADVDNVLRNRVACSASAWSRRHPEFSFMSRRVDGGYRVWRVPTTPKLIAAE